MQLFGSGTTTESKRSIKGFSLSHGTASEGENATCVNSTIWAFVVLLLGLDILLAVFSLAVVQCNHTLCFALTVEATGSLVKSLAVKFVQGIYLMCINRLDF